MSLCFIAVNVTKLWITKKKKKKSCSVRDGVFLSVNSSVDPRESCVSECTVPFSLWSLSLSQCFGPVCPLEWMSLCSGRCRSGITALRRSSLLRPAGPVWRSWPREKSAEWRPLAWDRSAGPVALEKEKTQIEERLTQKGNLELFLTNT